MDDGVTYTSLRIQVENKQKEQWRDYAKKYYNNNMSELIRVAVDQYINNNHTQNNSKSITIKPKGKTIKPKAVDLTSIKTVIDGHFHELNKRMSELEQKISDQSIATTLANIEPKEGGNKNDY